MADYQLLDGSAAEIVCVAALLVFPEGRLVPILVSSFREVASRAIFTLAGKVRAKVVSVPDTLRVLTCSI